MEPKEVALLVLMFIVFGVPALALAARIVIRAMLEVIDRLREGVAVSSRLPDPRVEALESEVRRLSAELLRLSESEASHRQLPATPKNDINLPGSQS